MGMMQGLTEFLPISSTAHLRILPALMGWPDFGVSFSAVIQLGSVIAVLVYFAQDLRLVLSGTLRSIRDRKWHTPEFRMFVGIAIGTLPIVALGLAIKLWFGGSPPQAVNRHRSGSNWSWCLNGVGGSSGQAGTVPVANSCIGWIVSGAGTGHGNHPRCLAIGVHHHGWIIFGHEAGDGRPICLSIGDTGIDVGRAGGTDFQLFSRRYPRTGGGHLVGISLFLPVHRLVAEVLAKAQYGCIRCLSNCYGGIPHFGSLHPLNRVIVRDNESGWGIAGVVIPLFMGSANLSCCQFDLRPYRRNFVKPLRTRYGQWSVREGAIVRLTGQDGRVGYGEIAPIPWFGSETLVQALEFCRSFKGSLSPERIDAVPSRLPACRFGLESAWNALQPDDPYGNTEVQSVPLSLSLCGLLPAGEAGLQEWRSLLDRGFTTLKWKIGVFDRLQEMNWLRQLRAMLPSEIELRLDANGGLEREGVVAWLQLCDRLHVEFLEQPLPPLRV